MGILQTVNYVSDAEGFKVAATNLPKAPVADVVSEAVADVASIVGPAAYVVPAPVTAPKTEQAPVIPYAYQYAPQQGYYQAPYTPAVVHTPVQPQTTYYAQQHGYYQAAPVVAPAPIAAPANSQFHAQSELGEYNYGYVNGESSKQEFKTADGIVQGTYSYVDANGILQTVNYISDAEGFKVAATNLPKAPVPAA